VAADDAGVTEGLGSRFFEVRNGTAALATPAAITAAALRPRAAEWDDLPVSSARTYVLRGLTGSRTRVPTDAAGTRHVALRATDLAALELGDGTTGTYQGFVVNGGRLEPLPIGSTLDPATGVFAWQLGPGFVGVYDLLFLRTGEGVRERIPVRIVVQPHDRAVATALVVTDPVRGTGVPAPVTVSGWALTGPARGIGEITVYAYPTNGSTPFFVGTAAVAPAALDPATPFGGQFTRARFAVPLTDLPAGTYDLVVVGRSRVSTALDAAVWVGPLAVR
jgi:hypothetical protein